MSPIFSSDVVTTPLAASVKKPRRLKRTFDGALKGIGMAILRISSTPGEPSISIT